MRRIKASNVIPAIVLVRVFPGLDLLLSADWLMQHMIEPIVEALTQTI
jgi:hypothetical protein